MCTLTMEFMLSNSSQTNIMIKLEFIRNLLRLRCAVYNSRWNNVPANLVASCKVIWLWASAARVLGLQASPSTGVSFHIFFFITNWQSKIAALLIIFRTFYTDAVKLFFSRVHQNVVITDQWFHRNSTQLHIYGGSFSQSVGDDALRHFNRLPLS